jgi:concentrative nucleoside transporter, CNT family
MLERLISLVGIAVIVGIAILLSEHRKSIQPRVLLWGLGLQLLLGILILTSFRLPEVAVFGPLAGAEVAPGRWLFGVLRDGINGLLEFTDEGTRFLFGPLADSNAIGFVFAIKVLPTIVFFSSIMAVLYHLGIMQKVIELFARLIRRTMGTSGAETLSVSANIFVGQTEAPLVVRPFVQNMTRSELMAVMTGGFATVAGGVMAAYVGFGVDAGHVLTASVISAPAAMLMAKLFVPERETPVTSGDTKIEVEKDTANVLEAAAGGAGDGLQLALNVGAMLLAFIALVAMLDFALSALPGNLSLGQIFGWIFLPLAFVMGVPTEDAMDVGKLMGLKVALNEFVAIVELRELRDAITPRSFVIATFALCGFANFSSIAIQIGGIGSIAPSRRSDLARLGMRAMFAGALATWLTAAVAALLIDNREAWDRYLDDVEQRIERQLAPDQVVDPPIPFHLIDRQLERARADLSPDGRRGDAERARRLDRLQAALEMAAEQARAEAETAAAERIAAGRFGDARDLLETIAQRLPERDAAPLEARAADLARLVVAIDHAEDELGAARLAGVRGETAAAHYARAAEHLEAAAPELREAALRDEAEDRADAIRDFMALVAETEALLEGQQGAELSRRLEAYDAGMPALEAHLREERIRARALADL